MKPGHLITDPPHAAVMNDVVTQAATNPLPVSVPPDTHVCTGWPIGEHKPW